MNIYLLSQHDRKGYDTYDSCVVYAESEELAQLIMPDGYATFGGWLNTWASSPENVDVTYIGKAFEGAQAGVVLASFNAG